MEEWKLCVPTYYGNVSRAQDTERPEFAEPLIPLLVRRENGVRIVLGSHDYEDSTAGDIRIERRPKGWAIFLHPSGDGDPSGYVYFLDDGSSFVTPEGVISPIRWLGSEEELPELRRLDEI